MARTSTMPYTLQMAARWGFMSLGAASCSCWHCVVLFWLMGVPGCGSAVLCVDMIRCSQQRASWKVFVVCQQCMQVLKRYVHDSLRLQLQSLLTNMHLMLTGH